jgi:predicted nuclease of restriction endonuclease-like (RecB) superfamily
MKKKQTKNSVTKTNHTTETVDALYERIADVIRKARSTIMRTVNTTMVKTYWHIGQHIIEEEQKGEKRAGYGKELLKTVSTKLSDEFGRGFGVDTLEDIRKFYLAYSNQPVKKSDTLRRKLEPPKFHPNLSWSQYLTLTRVTRPEARQFYELEAIKNRWSVRELKRQINSLLFDRLAKSKDKAGLLKLVRQGQ